MASPSIASSATSSVNTAGTSHAVTLPSGIAAGDLIVICSSLGSTAATYNAHADYTELLDDNAAIGKKILYRLANGTETTPTFTSSASTRSATCALRISGAEHPSIQPPVAAAVSSGTGTTPDPPSITPPSSKDYLFVAFCGSAGEQADDGTYCTAFPANYTHVQLEKTCGIAGSNLGGMIALGARQLTTGAAEDPGTFTVSETGNWRAVTFIVHPLVPGATPIPLAAAAYTPA